MDNVISFTPAELVGFITAIGGAIVTIGAVATIIFKVFNRIKEPEEKQNQRIQALEDKQEEQSKILETFRTYFANDDRRFKAIEKSNKITQGALLALLKHALNDGDKSTLKDAEKQLEEYLIDKDM